MTPPRPYENMQHSFCLMLLHPSDCDFEKRWEPLAAFIGVTVAELHAHATATCELPIHQHMSSGGIGQFSPLVPDFVRRLESDQAFQREVFPLLDIQHLPWTPDKCWFQRYDLANLKTGQVVLVNLDSTHRLGVVVRVDTLGKSRRFAECFDVTVVCPYYRNHAMTIHDADTTEISPYYVHERPLSDLFEIRKKCMGTLHLSTR